MSSKLHLILSLALALTSATPLCSAQEPVPNQINPLQGDWASPTLFNADKKTAWEFDVIIDGDSATFKPSGYDGRGQVWSIKVDTSCSPKRLTMTRNINAGKMVKINAVFELNEHEVTIAFHPGLDGSSLDEFPADIQPTKENGLTAFVLTPKSKDLGSR